MIPVDLALFLAIGLLGGAHCIGMCGPLVTVYAGRMDATDPARPDHLTVRQVRQHLLFNLGRTASYAVIGMVMGALGGVVLITTAQVTAVADPIRGVIGLAVGLVLVGFGLSYLLGRSSVADAALPNLGFHRLSGVMLERVDRLVGGPQIVALGSIHGLLPCPILYPAFLYAFVVGDALFGLIALGLLGLGTIPAVFLFGTVVETVRPSRRVQLHRILGVVFVVLAYIPLSHGLMLFDIHLPHPDIPIYQPLEGPGDGHH